MMNKTITQFSTHISTHASLSLGLLLSSLSLNAVAGGMNDDPILGKMMIGQFEKRLTDGADPVVLKAQGWLGKDLHKLWIKADIERVEGKNEELEFQALYSRAISPYWDFQAGWRHDARPEPSRDWLTLGFQGLSPYWFEIDTAIFIGKDSQVSARLEAEYEILFTQKLILTPEIEINAYSKDDPALAIGSGLSDLEFGLRLRYEIQRELAPYIGVNWTEQLGQTANIAKANGEDISDVQLVIGIRAWF